MKKYGSRRTLHIDGTQHASASWHHAVYAGIAAGIYGMLVLPLSLPPYTTWIAALSIMPAMTYWYVAHRTMTRNRRLPVLARHQPTPLASIDGEQSSRTR
ncbi:MAG TPA: hypothetical protein VEX37_02505 [Thermomicrobiales bacterium]|nr:hypothetical protein [Thermomicrobiales bacterium]